MKQTFEISTSTILKFFLVLGGLVFLWLIRDVLLIVFFALVLAAAIDGPVDWMAKHKIKRWLGATMIYVTIFAAVILFIYLAVPPLAGQVKILAADLPLYLSRVDSSLQFVNHQIGSGTIQGYMEKISGQLGWASDNIFGAVINIFGGIFSAFLIFIISIYLVIQDKGIKNFLASITPTENRPYVTRAAEQVQDKLGGWLRGQLLLMVIVGVLVFIGLSFLRIDFALTLALVAGFCEIIPYFGPVLGAIPAVAIALIHSPVAALLVVILFVVIQKLEGYLIVPLVMKRTVGLNPLVVLLALIIGGQLAGFIGVLLAVPLVAALSVFFGDIFLKEENK